ncbi:MAG: pilus assembly PilX N-terminal domain-containing protein [Candidatus Omnitrophica bacterium]|nr:pilus assembly PilX N-terminal domain-containing protein [Candidatus Omnitrophota bacterium]
MNKKGIALILGYIVVVVLTLLGAIFLSRSVVENRLVARHSDGTHAFWIAEAGLSDAFKNIVAGQPLPPADTPFGGADGKYTVIQNGYQIDSLGTFGTTTRHIRATISYLHPAFDNTVTAGQHLKLHGNGSELIVHGKTRLGDQFEETCSGCSGTFDDLQEHQPADEVTITIPDYNGNGTADEFEDFQLFGDAVINSYPPNEVVYIETSGTAWVYPSSELVGKKVVYVKGPSAGEGDVVIVFDGTWQDGEDLTIISTGEVLYLQPLGQERDSRLSVIAWSGYTEASILFSQHESMVFSHSDVDSTDIYSDSSFTGSYISNWRMDFYEYLGAKAELTPSEREDLPPGFQFLSNTGTPKLVQWQEIVP